jgi:hypothetical protein
MRDHPAASEQEDRSRRYRDGAHGQAVEEGLNFQDGPRPLGWRRRRGRLGRSELAEIFADDAVGVEPKLPRVGSDEPAAIRPGWKQRRLVLFDGGEDTRLDARRGRDGVERQPLGFP